MIPVLLFACFHYFFSILKSNTFLLLGTAKAAPARASFFHISFYPIDVTFTAHLSHSHFCTYSVQGFAGFLYVSGKQAFEKFVGFQK